MTKKEFLSDYEKLIVGAHVESFKNTQQFPVLELQNEKEDIIIELHIDCRISSNNSQLNDLVNQLSKYDEDTYEIGFFIGINRKYVNSIKFTYEGDLVLIFSNNIALTFKLIDEWVEPLNISVMKGNKYFKGCRLLNDGTIEQ